MPVEIATELIGEAARGILETMFFVEIADAAPPEEWTGPSIGAVVEFRGDRAGCFEIHLDEQLANEMALGFLGAMDPDEVDPEQVSQVVRELANMVCGATLSRMWPEAIFNLDAPRLSGPDAVIGPPDIVRWFDSGQGLIRLSLDWAPERHDSM